MSLLHQELAKSSSVTTPKPEEPLPDSPAATYLLATRIVSDLHQRASFDVPALLRDVIQSATELVAGAQYAGITVSQKRRLSSTAAATHRYPVLSDEIQNRCQQGPSLTAAATQDVARVDDLTDDDRWPAYRNETLVQTPIRSILSLGIFKEGSTGVALNFYSESCDAFSDESVDVGRIFGTHTALVWNMMRRDQQFRTALVSRDVIGQAKGRMMERFNIDATEAFDALRLMSQDSNTPIAQVAQRVVADEIWPSME